MTLLSHITAPDSVVLMAAFALGLMAGVTLSGIGFGFWANRNR